MESPAHSRINDVIKSLMQLNKDLELFMECFPGDKKDISYCRKQILMNHQIINFLSNLYLEHRVLKNKLRDK